MGSNALALKLKTKAPSPKPNNEHKNISYDRSSRAAPYLRVYSTSSGASGPARATRSTSEHASGQGQGPTKSASYFPWRRNVQRAPSGERTTRVTQRLRPG